MNREEVLSIFPMVDIDKLDSKEEKYFVWYMCELAKAGYVVDLINEPCSYPLFDGLKKEYNEIKKTKTNVKTETLLQDSVYTPDWTVVWKQEAIGLFIDDIKSKRHFSSKKNKHLLIAKQVEKLFHTVIETKGDFDNNNMTRLAKTNIKWVYQKHGVFVNLVKIPSLFKKTFTPTRYLFQDVRKGKRTIKFNVRTLDEFKATLQA